jgi:hypothetical protein
VNHVRVAFLLVVLLPPGAARAPGEAAINRRPSAREVTVTGTVKEFQWTNPHVILWVNADAADGAPPAVWSLELTSPGNLTRTGWNRKALSPGDKVVVDLNPLRNGGHGGALVKVTVSATGQVFATNFRDMEKPGLK